MKKKPRLIGVRAKQSLLEFQSYGLCHYWAAAVIIWVRVSGMFRAGGSYQASLPVLREVMEGSGS